MFFNKINSLQTPPTPDLGAFVRAQILEQQDQPNPIHFVTPDGVKGKVWLASDDRGNRIIGDDRHWRVHVREAAKIDEDARRARQVRRTPVRLMHSWDIELERLRGFRIRIAIDGEKGLQVLGCGRRIVTVQFRGNKVLLHHNGNKATMKRTAFKTFLARIDALGKGESHE